MSTTAAPAISRPPAAARRPWTAARITGHVLMAFWIVSGVGLALYLGQNLFSTFASQYLPKYVTGAVVTLKLTIYSFLIGAALSVPLALACSAQNTAIRSLGNAYVYFFRGTPCWRRCSSFITASVPSAAPWTRLACGGSSVMPGTACS